MNFHLPKIYPITDTVISGLSHAEQVRRLIDGGAEFIQLREKRESSGTFYSDALEALEIARKNGARIIINDRVDIALALKADGVHLGQDDLPPEQARQIFGPDAIIGFSTHSIEQVVDAVKFSVDYIAIGPIFLTTSKENSDEVLGVDSLYTVRSATGQIPLVAIGGIDLDSARTVLDAGADSAAIISGILSDSDRITERFEKYNTV